MRAMVNNFQTRKRAFFTLINVGFLILVGSQLQFCIAVKEWREDMKPEACCNNNCGVSHEQLKFKSPSFAFLCFYYFGFLIQKCASFYLQQTFLLKLSRQLFDYNHS